MAIKFLSDEWAKEVTNRLQTSEEVMKAAKGLNVTIQQVVTDAPGGESKHRLKVTGGIPEVALGGVDKAEATITQNYATIVAVDKGELNPQAAFMQGKLKIQGNLMKLMQLQGFLQTVFKAVSDLEREY